MKRFAIILAGCGQHDGSETHEVILTLLSLEQEHAQWQAFAPDIQHPVVNHLTETHNASETRSVLQESARLVRGRVQSLELADLDEFDGLIFPGGLGAVTTLCDWFEKQSDFTFNPQVKRLIDGAVAQRKAMGFICIAPIMIPKIYSDAHLTIGNDSALAQQIEDMGSHHMWCAAQDVVVDRVNKVVSTPANMVANNIDEVYTGIRKLIKELIAMSNG
jgi:enhancing lycopene biosynthesis protein 2